MSPSREEALLEKTERNAVRVVEALVDSSPRLEARFQTNDKTPLVDGDIWLYEGDIHTNATVESRVPVQIKGRAPTKKIKRKRTSANFPVERDTLRFLMNDGGGLYFVVIIEQGAPGRAFYAVLNPYKIRRFLDRMPASQETKTIACKPFPSDPAQIERIVRYAATARRQDAREHFDPADLDNVRSLTIHTLGDIAFDRPTLLNPDETDFLASVETATGATLFIDGSLVLKPQSYIPHEVGLTVRCGAVSFTHAVVRQLSPSAAELEFSAGIRITLDSSNDGRVSFKLNMELAGSIADQLRDAEFLLAMSGGEPLFFDGEPHHFDDTAQLCRRDELLRTRDQLRMLSDVCEALHFDPHAVNLADVGEREKADLHVLHPAIVLNEEIAASPNGAGRYTLALGERQLVLVVAAGSDDSHWRVLDPFDPRNRHELRLLRVLDGGDIQEVPGATIYEALSVKDLATTLNLNLEQILQAYLDVEDTNEAKRFATARILALIKAADAAKADRDPLLRAADALNEWMITGGDDMPIHLINRWQIKLRRKGLTAQDNTAIRKARVESIRTPDENSNLRAVCYSILLGDVDEFGLALEDLTASELDQMTDWPIWALRPQPSMVVMSA
mgnify:FL=1